MELASHPKLVAIQAEREPLQKKLLSTKARTFEAFSLMCDIDYFSDQYERTLTELDPSVEDPGFRRREESRKQNEEIERLHWLLRKSAVARRQASSKKPFVFDVDEATQPENAPTDVNDPIDADIHCDSHKTYSARCEKCQIEWYRFEYAKDPNEIETGGALTASAQAPLSGEVTAEEFVRVIPEDSTVIDDGNAGHDGID